MSTVSSSIVETATAAAATATANWWDASEIQLDENFFAYQEEVRKSILAFASPLNLTIALVIASIFYLRVRSSGDVTLQPTRPITFATFTPRTLLKYNGTTSPLNPDSRVYIAVRQKVYDVSPGRNFYGPGGPYENFAGRDATRGLACQSFDEDMLTKNLDGPLDPCTDLDEEQLENLRGWIERFDEKYLIVGRLTAYNEQSSEF